MVIDGAPADSSSEAGKAAPAITSPAPPSWPWRRAAGAIAAVGAAAWFDFFFTVPYYRFTIRNSADVTTFVLLLVVGVAVSQLAALW